MQAQGKIKKKYAIDDERAALRTAISHWLDEGVGGKPFAGGDAPHFGDVCVYGCLKAIDRTSAHKEIMAETAELRQWYQRMAELVGEPKGRYAMQ
jgi:microsomal prostaglandin-E synthase 2